jgi:alpha-ribazole phosphatase
LSRLLVVRHGETELKSSLRYWGSTDIALSDLGLRQAELLKKRLDPEKIDFIFSSDLKRALVTAQIIAVKHSLKVTACPELREIDFGRLEGLTFDEINRLYPEVARMWIERDTCLAYPDGESFDELNKRVYGFKSRLEGYDEDQTVLIVAHSGVLRTLLCQLMGMEPWQWWQIRIDMASLSVIETYRQGAIITVLNDVSHLKERSLL